MANLIILHLKCYIKSFYINITLKQNNNTLAVTFETSTFDEMLKNRIISDHFSLDLSLLGPKLAHIFFEVPAVLDGRHWPRCVISRRTNDANLRK